MESTIANQWTQEEIGVIARNNKKSMIDQEIAPTNASLVCPSSAAAASSERKAMRAQKEQQVGLNCPRCNSTNTKFCYYNNYSLTQPRYFCKTCRRYWTQGGTLRNVPVGGGSRSKTSAKKHNPLSIPSSSAAATIINPHHLNLLNPSTAAPPHHHFILNMAQNPNNSNIQAAAGPQQHHHNHHPNLGLFSMPSAAAQEQFIYRANNNTSSLFSAATGTMGFPSISLYGNEDGGGGRLVFPFGGIIKQMVPGSRINYDDDHKAGYEQNSNVYWNVTGGMLGGGSW